MWVIRDFDKISFNRAMGPKAPREEGEGTEEARTDTTGQYTLPDRCKNPFSQECTLGTLPSPPNSLPGQGHKSWPLFGKI